VNPVLRKRFAGTLFSAAVGALLTACGGGGDDTIDLSSGTAITDVTVVDTRDGSSSAPMSVVIDGGKITRITPLGVRASGAAQVVDGAGKFVVPGYADMHTHAVETADLTPSYFPLMLAHGITGFREQSLYPANLERAAKLNRDSAAGLVAAPEAFIADGEGHLNPAFGATAGPNAALQVIDHLGAGPGLVLDCSAEVDAIRADLLANGYKPPFPADFVINPRAYDAALNAPFYQRVIDTFSESRCSELSRAFVANETWQALTLIRLRTQAYGNDPQYRADPDLKYVSATRLAAWNKLGDQFATLPSSAVATLQQYYALQKRVTRLMLQHGVKMLAGTDGSGVWLVPGVSLHLEFREMADAGLSPLEVLQSTTLNAAEYLNRLDRAGTVDEGKDADLVLLDANPVASVDNLGAIAGLFLDGRYFSKAALEKMKSDVAAAPGG
jgi:hypothetical protein